MTELRDTFAYVAEVEHRLKAAASLLGISENTLRNTIAESGMEVRRANQDNPNAPAVRLFDLPTIFALADYRRSKRAPSRLEGKRPCFIAVEIIKGGTGKTTTTAEVAIQLQLQGLKTLVIDIDIQANLTQLMGYEADLTIDEAVKYGLSDKAIVNGTFASICAPVVLGRNANLVDARSVIKYPFGACGPAVIPADTYFSELENNIFNYKGKREMVFRKLFVDSLSGNVPGLNVAEFDVVLFDCPPNVSFVSTNALACADIVIAPVKMDSFSVKGLSRLIGEINTVQTEYGKAIVDPMLVILPTFFSTNLPRVGRMQEKLSVYRAMTSPVAISQSEELNKSAESYLPLTVLKPSCQPVKEYRLFVDHLMNMIAEASSKPRPLAV